MTWHYYPASRWLDYNPCSKSINGTKYIDVMLTLFLLEYPTIRWNGVVARARHIDASIIFFFHSFLLGSGRPPFWKIFARLASLLFEMTKLLFGTTSRISATRLAFVIFGRSVQISCIDFAGGRNKRVRSETFGSIFFAFFADKHRTRGSTHGRFDNLY